MKDEMDYAKADKPLSSSEIKEDENGIVIRVATRPNLRDRILVKYGKNKLKLLRRLLSALYLFMEYFRSFDRNYPIYQAAKSYLIKEEVDVIVATGGPFFQFKYAAKLSQKFNIPWVADYRDGWSTNYQVHARGGIHRAILKVMFARIETRIVRSATLVTTVSLPLRSILSEFLKKDVRVVYNGYDEQALSGIDRIDPPSDKLIIMYTGSIYNYQRLEVFLEGFARFVFHQELTPDNVCVEFVGVSRHPEQVDRIRRFDPYFNRYFKFSNRIPYKDNLEKITGAHLCLILANESIDGSCTKVYDYLALEKRILVSVNDHSTLERLIEETNGGVLCKSEEDVEHHLTLAYNELKQHGTVQQQTRNYKQFSRLNQAKEMAKLLLEVEGKKEG